MMLWPAPGNDTHWCCTEPQVAGLFCDHVSQRVTRVLHRNVTVDDRRSPRQTELSVRHGREPKQQLAERRHAACLRATERRHSLPSGHHRQPSLRMPIPQPGPQRCGDPGLVQAQLEPNRRERRCLRHFGDLTGHLVRVQVLPSVACASSSGCHSGCTRR
jgi:hypothetical protein